MTPAPDDLGPRGGALWGSIAHDFELGQHELDLLHEASRVADRLDALDVVVRAEGVTIAAPQGVKAHPALVEACQQELLLSRLLASLRIPDEPGNTPQRRGGSRSPYLARRSYGSRSTG